MDKSERRQAQAHKRRYGPRLTNPGLRIVQRELAAPAGLVACPLCLARTSQHCNGCSNERFVTPADAGLISRMLRRH